jgi:hypothetical protein
VVAGTNSNAITARNNFPGRPRNRSRCRLSMTSMNVRCRIASDLGPRGASPSAHRAAQVGGLRVRKKLGSGDQIRRSSYTTSRDVSYGAGTAHRCGLLGRCHPAVRAPSLRRVCLRAGPAPFAVPGSASACLALRLPNDHTRGAGAPLVTKVSRAVARGVAGAPRSRRRANASKHSEKCSLESIRVPGI